MISLILPTLGNRIEEMERLFNSLNNQIYKEFEVIIVSQGNHNKIAEMIQNSSLNIKHIKSEKKGLSLCRNIALKYAKGDKIIFADDDAWYNENSLKIVEELFEKSKADILCFQIMDPISNKKYKDYSKHKKNVDILQILKKSSIEICINLKNISIDKIKFDENIGLGTECSSGEENILLANMIRYGYKIEYIPRVYVYHKRKESKYLDQNFIKDKIIVFKKIYGNKIGYILSIFLILKNIKRFNIKKNKIFKIIKDSY